MTVSRIHAALRVVVGLAVAGALCGALWALVAPPIHSVVGKTAPIGPAAERSGVVK